MNGAFGREIIPILCAAGVDVSVKNADGKTAFDLAISKSKAMVDALRPFLPPGFAIEQWRPSVQDPVGSWVCACEYGFNLLPSEFASDVLSKQWIWTECWTTLRGRNALVLDNSDKDAFRSLLQCREAELWKWASSEPQMQQHPLSGDTMFHLLCRTEVLTVEQKLAVLADFKAQWRNPLVPNRRNELCVTLAKEPELKKALQEYACWHPNRLAMHWFGPLFQRRARALLLVCYRLKAKHPKALEGLNRDIRHLLVKYASRVEYIYVPPKR
jgi:hypothetical protein